MRPVLPLSPTPACMVARCRLVVLRACSRVALSDDSRYRPVKTASSWGLCLNTCACLTGGLPQHAPRHTGPPPAMRCAILWGCGDTRSTRIALSVGALVDGRAAKATHHTHARPQPPVVRSGYACSRGSCVCCGRRSGRTSAIPPHARATLRNHSGHAVHARTCTRTRQSPIPSVKDLAHVIRATLGVLPRP